MKKILLLVLLLLIGSLTSIPEIKTTNDDIRVHDFQNHITYLASDELEGRSSGTQGDQLAKDYIVNHFTTAGLPTKRVVEVQEHYVYKDRKNKKNKVLTYNIIATLPGTDDKLKDEYVVIGGHYDSVSNKLDKIHNGADDNASGTSMVLELFEKFAASNTNKRTLIFMAFGGEELGLLGSKYFVNNPTINLQKVQLMVNLDMVGRLDNEKNLQLGGTLTAVNFDKKLEPFLNQMENRWQNNLNITELGKGIFKRSDHYSFYLKDIPVLFFFTGLHEDYHGPTDDSNKINYQGMKVISDLVHLIMEEFANTPEKLVFQPVELEEQSMPVAEIKVTLGVMPDYAHEGDGLKIDAVIDNRPGEKAGMLAGDIVVDIGGTPIKDIYAYMKILSQLNSGDKAEVKVLRNDSEMVLQVQF
jgi:hypothetical protein